MNRLALFAIVLTIFAAGCGSTSPTTPSSNPNVVKFTAALLPSNEVPAVNNADQAASGTATITFNVSRDASGNITSATSDFTVQLAGFPSGTTLTGSHIHHAAAGQTAGVLVNTGIATGDVVLATGTGSFTRTGITSGMDPANTLDMINNPANYYFNVHTTINTGGAARGQLVKQ
jgi:hypothetical protein